MLTQKTMQEVPKVAAKKERLRLKVEWEQLYEKDMECKNWNYKICSYYLWKAEKQTRKYTLKEQYEVQLDLREVQINI